MTNCTPAHARALADMMRSAGPLTRTNVVDALLSLADQVDGLTAENANILRASLYSADLATQAMEDVKTLTAERDALKSVADTHPAKGASAQPFPESILGQLQELAKIGITEFRSGLWIGDPMQDAANAAIAWIKAAAPLVPEPGARDDPLPPEYGETDFGFTFAGISLADGDKRLMSMLVAAFGTAHPAIDDLTALLFRARPQAPQAAPVAQLSEPPASAALMQILKIVQGYLPPNGTPINDAMSEIIACIDPWPDTGFNQFDDLLDDAAEWSGYVEVDTAPYGLKRHLKEVFEKYGITAAAPTTPKGAA